MTSLMMVTSLITYRELSHAFIIIPGLNGSDHNHWQSTWESGWLANSTRIAPASWTQPLTG